MHTPIGTIPRLRVGQFSAMSGPGYEVTNVAVRTTDYPTILAIIHAREADLAAREGKPLKGAAAAYGVASFALAAREALATDCPRELAIANLETCVSRAVDLLNELRGAA